MGLKMRCRIGGCLSLVVFLVAGPVAAQNNTEPLKLDLQTCVERALEANPEIEEAKLEVTQAEWQLRAAKLGRTPKVDLFNLMGIVDDAEGNAVNGDSIDGEYGFFNKLDVNVTIPLYTFGRLTNSINAAAENVNVQKASQIKTRSELVRKVHQLYYGLLLGNQLLESTRELKDNFTEARDIAEERLEKGESSVTEADVLKLRVGLAGVTEGVRKLEREVEVTKAALRQAIGLGPNVPFELADSVLKPADFELEPIEKYLDEAGVNNPDLKRVKAAVIAEEARYKAERSKYYPTILAVGGAFYGVAPGREDQDSPFAKDDFNYSSIGGALGIKWDLNFFQTNAEVQKQRVSFLKMKNKLKQGEEGIDLLVKEKYYRVKERQANLESGFESRKAGRALLVLTLTNFKFGIGSGKDVFDSLSVYARTAGNYAEAVYDYNIAVIELKNAAGMPFVPRVKESG